MSLGHPRANEVEEACCEEIGYMKRREIWFERPVAECWQKIGKALVCVRWVDVRRGSGDVWPETPRLAKEGKATFSLLPRPWKASDCW